jgi:glycosyltransferase involved in cell wall biosynthesis
MPLVSVIIPTFNRVETLPRAIESVLKQSFEDYELIIVDDGSTDGTQALLRSFSRQRMRVLRQQNGGCAAARNLAIHAATTELIAFLDSDDRWTDDKLDRQLALMNDNRVVLSATNWADEKRNEHGEFHSTGVSTRVSLEQPLDFLCQPGGHKISLSTWMIRRDALLKVGVFDERMRNGSDTRLLFRLAFEGIFALEPKVCAIRASFIDSAKITHSGTFDYDCRATNAGLETLAETYYRAWNKPTATRKAIQRLRAEFLITSGKQAAARGEYALARERFWDALAAGVEGRKLLHICVGLISPAIVGKKVTRRYHI